MFNATVVGKMYNGTVGDYTRKFDGEEVDKQYFRGRLNYRDNAGKYHWVDAVCFKDYGETGGLVGWLGDNFEVEEGDKNGSPIIVTGYMRPSDKKKTVEIKGKGGKTKEIKVDYESFEFVIEEARFVPNEQSGSKKSDTIEDEDFDFDDDDEIEVVDKSSKKEDKESKSEDKSEKEEKSSKSSKKDKKAKDIADDDEFFE